MIAYLQGTVHQMPADQPELVLLTSCGVGYEVTLPAFVLQSLQSDDVGEGDAISLDIYYHVTERQPAPVLVGFRSAWEKRFFERLIQVEGVGPARAAAAMIFPVADTARAIESEDAGLLRRMPGIGERAAQKIVATLRGKVTEWAAVDETRTAPAPAPEEDENPTRTEAIEVLVNLGHRAASARDSVDGALSRRPELSEDPEELIREVFRSLTRQT